MSTLVVATLKSNSSSPPAFQNTSGTEVGTLCRAWVNFNGTGTVAIRASFNVSSITDNGVGNYTVNFTNALADANYVVLGGVQPSDTADYIVSLSNYGSGTRTASAVQMISKWTNFATSATADWNGFNVAIFR
jgi:hypothetical protein